MSPILITGGTGMVGHNVRDLAGERGIEVVAPSRAELDLMDADAVVRYFRRVKPRLIVHAAGKVGGIEANMREPVAFLTQNWEMGRNVVLGAREAGVGQLINLGSSCMYPRDHETPLREEEILSGPLEPTNEAYAIAKSAVLRLCDYVRAETPRFQYKTLIPCNLYGRYDTFDPRRSHLAAAVLHKLHRAKAERRSSVDIWGDGKARREFLYAADLADAILAAAGRFESLPPVMNVGAGVDRTVDEYYHVAAEVVGYTGGFIHDLDKPVGMKRKLMDVGRATAWGWRAKTPLRDGLAEAYRYYLAAVSSEPAAARG
jgi:GDP-L-fucose synthase